MSVRPMKSATAAMATDAAAASQMRCVRCRRRFATVARHSVGSAVGRLDDRRVFNTNTFRLEGSAKAGRRATLNTGVEWYDYGADYEYRSQAQLDPLLAAV